MRANSKPQRRMRIRQNPKLVNKARDIEYLNSHAGKWVLVADERIVASGDTLEEVTKQIEREKYVGNLSDTFIFHVPTPEETLAVLALL